MKIRAEKHFFSNKKLLLVIGILLGLVLVAASVTDSKINKYEESDFSSTNSYTENLESKLEAIISHATGDESAKVMITSKYKKSNDVSVFSESSDGILYKNNSQGTSENISNHEITGVMIVCKNIYDSNDLLTIKQAAATTLGISKTKIYIIGGKRVNEKTD